MPPPLPDIIQGRALDWSGSSGDESDNDTSGRSVQAPLHLSSPLAQLFTQRTLVASLDLRQPPPPLPAAAAAANIWQPAPLGSGPPQPAAVPWVGGPPAFVPGETAIVAVEQQPSPAPPAPQPPPPPHTPPGKAGMVAGSAAMSSSLPTSALLLGAGHDYDPTEFLGSQGLPFTLLTTNTDLNGGSGRHTRSALSGELVAAGIGGHALSTPTPQRPIDAALSPRATATDHVATSAQHARQQRRRTLLSDEGPTAAAAAVAAAAPCGDLNNRFSPLAGLGRQDDDGNTLEQAQRRRQQGRRRRRQKGPTKALGRAAQWLEGGVDGVVDGAGMAAEVGTGGGQQRRAVGESGERSEVHFMASADTLSQIFTLPYCDSEVSIVLHRVGDMLLMEGNLNGVEMGGGDVRDAASERRRGSDHGRRAQLEANFLFFSSEAPTTEGRPLSPHGATSHTSSAGGDSAGRGAGSGQGGEVEPHSASGGCGVRCVLSGGRFD
jgi:hypothetical protein